MAYHVEIESSAAKSLMRISRGDRASARRIDQAIKKLADDPRSANAIKMTATDTWRIRVGDYRVVYLIEDHVRVVTVTKIGHRRDVYER